MPDCTVLVELAITFIHDYMVVTVTVSSIIPMMDKTQVNSDCEFYDIYRLLIFLTKCGPYDAMAPSQNY